MANVPEDLRYTKTHEWIRVQDGIATVGITDFAQSELGDVVYVDLKNVGLQVSAGDSIGSVESVKTVSDVYAPVSGEIVETNDVLVAQSELVNSDPFGRGYMVKIRLDGAPSGDLLDAAAYAAMVG